MRFKNYPMKESLTILQINVGRGASAHEIALFQAYFNDINIILIQEPYIFKNLARKITKKHPSYECFSPTDSWETSGRPRVLTYIRKKKGIQAFQLRPNLIDQEILSDLLLLQISARSGQSALLLNLYNAPYGENIIRPNKAIQALISLPESYFSQPTLLAGDFNLLHSRWQPSIQRDPSAYSGLFTEWLDKLGLVFISEIDTPTHNKGNVLDLTFTSSFLALSGANTRVATDLDVTSDHCPLLTVLPWGQRHSEAPQKLKFSTLDLTRFHALLALNLENVRTAAKTEEELNYLANETISAIHSAYAASATRSLPQGRGQPWWNTECGKALQDYRSGLALQRDFRRVIKRAQRQYWRDKISATTTSKEVFDMAKWHRTTGSYRSPPMKDPQQPNSPLAIDTQGKRDILARNLLQNSTETGDIPINTPAVPSSSLPFPDISMTQVERAVLDAGNTTPGSDELPTSILKVAWPLIKNRVLSLYQGCLSTGYHPRCFRHAVLAIIQKPNKAD
jgi:hypothetical protein